MKRVTLLHYAGAIRLSKEQLEEFERLIRADVDDQGVRPYIKVSFDGEGIEEPSVSALLEHGAALPSRVDECEIGLFASKGRHLCIRMHHNYVQVYATGEDGTWVRGKDAQLTAFLKKHRPWYRNGLYVALPFAAVFGVALARVIDHHYFPQDSRAVPWLLAVMVISAGAIVVTGNPRFFPFVDIRFRNNLGVTIQAAVSWAIILTLLLTAWIAIATQLTLLHR